MTRRLDYAERQAFVGPRGFFELWGAQAQGVYESCAAAAYDYVAFAYQYFHLFFKLVADVLFDSRSFVRQVVIFATEYVEQAVHSVSIPLLSGVLPPKRDIYHVRQGQGT